MAVVVEKNLRTLVSLMILPFLPHVCIPGAIFDVLSMGQHAPHVELALNIVYTLVMGRRNILGDLINLRPCSVKILLVAVSCLSLLAGFSCTSILG